MSPLSRRALIRSALTLAASAAIVRPSMAQQRRPGLSLPERATGADGGKAFAARIADLSDRQRYACMADAILAGNVPSFQRLLSRVDIAPTGGGPRLSFFVTPDYLSVGSLEDFVRVPLDLPQAARVATALDMALPTPTMVDAIYAAAGTTLTPTPMPPTNQMRSMAYVQRHQMLVEQGRAEQPLLPIIAGHKKDLVLSNRLHAQPDRVAIYGWHRPSGRPIQPLSLVHGKHYADYSHGIRQVSRTVLVDEAPMDLFAVLEDARLAPLLTREGTLLRAENILRTV